jgi:hypothetical protein
MNSNDTRDNVAPFDAQCAETETYPTEKNNAGATPARSCDLFEGGLGI